MNAYEVLGIIDGLSATSDDIKKVYRKLAIVKHPDKNPNNPHAAAEFAQIDAAYRLLLDPAARSALDDVLHARASRIARESQMSDKRKKMKEDLETREKKVVSERNEEDLAKARLKAELDRLRSKAEQEASERARVARQRDQAGTSTSQQPSSTSSLPGESERMEIIARTVKVSWDTSVKVWSSGELKEKLEGFGVVVENVFMSDKGKEKGKASAKVVLASKAHAAIALNAVTGEDSSFLSIATVLKGLEVHDAEKSLNREEGEEGRGGKRQKAGPLFPSSSPHLAQDRPLFPLPLSSTRATPLFPSAASSFPISSSSFPKASSFPSARHQQGGVESGFEAQVIERMRREAERKRALAEAEATEV